VDTIGEAGVLEVREDVEEVGEEPGKEE